jgi:hypothetical protein
MNPLVAGGPRMPADGGGMSVYGFAESRIRVSRARGGVDLTSRNGKSPGAGAGARAGTCSGCHGELVGLGANGSITTNLSGLSCIAYEAVVRGGKGKSHTAKLESLAVWHKPTAGAGLMDGKPHRQLSIYEPYTKAWRCGWLNPLQAASFLAFATPPSHTAKNIKLGGVAHLAAVSKATW